MWLSYLLNYFYFVITANTFFYMHQKGQMSSDLKEINASKNGSSGVFTSPGYPGNYPNNVLYKWALKTGDSRATIVLKITDFSVVEYRSVPKCRDYLQVGIPYWGC